MLFRSAVVVMVMMMVVVPATAVTVVIVVVMMLVFMFVLMMMVVVSAAAVMIVVMVMVMPTAAVIIIVFGDGLPAVFVEYHTDLIHNQNLLFLGGCFVDGFRYHIHHIMDGIDRGQSTCQILHCQLSGLGRQGEIGRASCRERV